MHWQDEEAATLPNAVPIRRCRGLTPEATLREHLCGEGLPVVVTDAQQEWQARKLWSFDYFARHFGDETLLVNDRAPFRPDDDPPNQTLRISMREYVRYTSQRPSNPDPDPVPNPIPNPDQVPHGGRAAGAQPCGARAWLPFLRQLVGALQRRAYAGRAHRAPRLRARLDAGGAGGGAAAEQ